MGTSRTKVNVTRSDSRRGSGVRTEHDFRLYVLIGAFVALVCAAITWKELRRRANPPDLRSEREVATQTERNVGDTAGFNDGAPSQITVLRVIDGDTFIAIGQDKIEFTVRLARIDAPELGQQCGLEAKDRLEKVILHRQVILRHASRGKYGRVVAEVFENGSPIDEPLVREGLAWIDPSLSHQTTLTHLEKEARQARRGLWAEENPIEPWTWRLRRGM
jgi:endonuclease YncB( thermonuclease family)